VNNVWKKPGTDYTIDYDTGVITFSQALSNKTVEVFYKLYKHEQGSVMALPHQYDLAQIISRDKAVVGYAAFWPVLSDYTVDGWDRALEPLYNVSEPNMLPVPSEPDIPYVVGEWDFMLDYDEATANWGEQFRGVTVYGLVNYHDADDAQGSDLNGDLVVENQVDREVQYQLDEVFNPWDLYSAVEKQELRWFDNRTLTVASSTITLTSGLDKTSFVTSSGNGLAEWSYAISAHSKYWSAKLSVPVNRTSSDGAVVGVPYGDVLCHISEISFWYYKPDSVYEDIYPYLVLDIDYDGDGDVDHYLVNAFSWPKVEGAWTQASPSGIPDVYMGQWNLVPDIDGLETGYAN